MEEDNQRDGNDIVVWLAFSMRLLQF